MQEHILFIDTEASGWPRNWGAPYSRKNSWPYCLQVSWIICNSVGQRIKTENHFINGNVKIEQSAFKIHGISNEFLLANGENKKDVMTMLANDLLIYKPLIVGHFVEFDMHMIGAEFQRTGIPNLVFSLPSFCTMVATAKYAGVADKKYLRLNELYNILFDKIQEGQHNALFDAEATAECFFELLKKNEITQQQITDQQLVNTNKITQVKEKVFLFVCIALLLTALTILIIRLL